MACCKGSCVIVAASSIIQMSISKCLSITSGRERLPFAGSAVTPPPNRAYSFDCTRLSLYVCLEKGFVREFTFMQQVMAPPTENQRLSIACCHHPLPQFFLVGDLFHPSNMMHLNWPLPGF